MRDFQKSNRSISYSSNGMVATSHPIASIVGLDILKKGGNAVDAAIAMALVLPICEPQSTGLFGDVFAMIKPSDNDNFVGINGSGKAPKNISPHTLRKKFQFAIPEDAVETITMPGAVAAFESLNRKFGKMELSDLCQPAINYSEKGVIVSPRVAFDWSHSFNHLKKYSKKFYSNNGKPLLAGDIFKSSGQSEVLKKIAKFGAKGFYEGEVAKDFIDSLIELGGVHEEDDFSSVTVEYVDPCKAKIGNCELFEIPPNGQGLTAILILKILEKLEVYKLDAMCAKRVHLEAEAAKIAYLARDNFIADTKFYDLDYDIFMSDDKINSYVNLIKEDKVRDFNKILDFTPHKDTVLLTVVDKNRQMISLIFSIFNSFGSGYCSKKYGILFHNRGAGFNLKKGHPNEIIGGKRPLHTIIPAFLKEDKKFIMPFGVMGGQYQANGHARLISNLLHHKMDIQSAIDFPRSFPFNGFLNLENGYNTDIASKLQKIGHIISRPEQPIGGAQAILYDLKKDVLMGGSDPRKDGCALGY